MKSYKIPNVEKRINIGKAKRLIQTAIFIVIGKITFIIEAFVLAGEFLNRGILNEVEVVRALLLGSILSSIPTLRFLAPYYMGIYGFKDGFNIMISTLVRVVITALFVIITLIL